MLEFTTNAKKPKLINDNQDAVPIKVKKEEGAKDAKPSMLPFKNKNDQGHSEVDITNYVPTNKDVIANKECNSLLESTICMLGLTRCNVAGLGDYQLLALILEHLGKRDMTKLIRIRTSSSNGQ